MKTFRWTNSQHVWVVKLRPIFNLSVTDIRVLIRTGIVEDFGKRIITARETMIATDGRNTTPQSWRKLLRLKLVKNTRQGQDVKLTPSGVEKLRQVFSTLRSTTYRSRLTNGGQVSTIKVASRRSARRRKRHMSTRKKTSKKSRKTNGHAAPTAVNPHAAKVQHHVNSMYRRLGRQVAKLRAYQIPDDVIMTRASTALDSLHEVSTLLAKVPETWQPVRGSITTAPIDVGATVIIKDKYAAKYSGVVDKNASIVVAGLNGTQLKCQTVCDSEKTILLVPRSHVQRAVPAESN